MTVEEAVQKIEEQRKKGWFFEIHADVEGWGVRTVGKGLATGNGTGSTLEAALDIALNEAFSMVDDPEVMILRYGDRIKKVAGEVFGQDVVVEDFELEENFDLGPLRIGLRVIPKIEPKPYVDLELKFQERLIAEFPKEAYVSFTITTEWPEDEPTEKK